MKRLMLVGFVALGSAFSAQADAVTATWQGASGAAWETAGNWDTGAVPGPTTDVCVPTKTTISVGGNQSCQALTVKSGTTVFSFGDNAQLAVAGSVTNFGGTTYQDGKLSIGSKLVVGYAKTWPSPKPGEQSSNVKATFTDCEAEIGGLIHVAGYAGNGITVGSGSVVKCGGYYVEGTRNVSTISGVFVSTGDIEIHECYPNTSYPYPFTIDGGVVTNDGALMVSGPNSHSIPFRIQNGSSWKQVGDTTVGGSSSQNRHDSSLRILSGSTFEGGKFLVGNQNKKLNNGVLVDGSSSLTTAGDFTVLGFKDWVTISDKSSFTMTSGSFKMATNEDADGARFSVLGGSTCSLRGLSVGAGKKTDHSVIVVSNSTLSVVSGVSIPAGTADKCVDLIVSGTEDAPAKASFPGGFVIGSANINKDSAGAAIVRTDPTTVVLDNGVLEIGKIDPTTDAGTSGDGRLGKNDIAGVGDNATNRIVIAGKMSCFVPKHRMMTAGNPIIEFQVPEGGYQNADYDNCGFYVKNAYLTNAKIIIDVTRLARDPEWKEYVLARSTVNDLNVDLNKVEVVAPTDCDCKWEVCWKDKKSPLSIKVRFPPKGLMLIVR